MYFDPLSGCEWIVFLDRQRNFELWRELIQEFIKAFTAEMRLDVLAIVPGSIPHMIIKAKVFLFVQFIKSLAAKIAIRHMYGLFSLTVKVLVVHR